jgi:hypothetical protein
MTKNEESPEVMRTRELPLEDALSGKVEFKRKARQARDGVIVVG